MSNEDLAPILRAWLKGEDGEPDDVLSSTSQVSAQAQRIRQRGRWWPLPSLRSPSGRPNTPRSSSPPRPVPVTYGRSGTVTGRTQPTFGAATWLVVGALVLALGGVLVLAQPFGRQEATLPGAATAPASAAPEEQATVSPSPLPAPVGLIVIGHAALLGTNSDPSRASGFPVPENSWVTGTGLDVDSIYERLFAVRPETEGNVSNQAGQVFAQSSALAGQAKAALAAVPTPALVIIQTIDNDIRCDGTDEEHVPVFGQAVARTLDIITTASPDSRILMVGPSPIGQWVEFIQANPEFMKSIPEGHGRTDWMGTGMCDVFDPAGQVVPEHVSTLSAIYDAYEAEQERVCSLVPQCRSDGAVDDDYIYDPRDWSDWAFLSIEGNAAMAERYWPAVAGILGLGT